jgi:ankyrin repeat protein
MGNSEMGFVNTALGLAVTFNNLDAVKLLVAFKADGAGLSNNALNCWANSCHHIDRPKTKKLDEFFLIKKAILKQLLMAGADINALSRNRYGGGEIQTPIETCSTYGKAGDPVTDKLIEMLLEHGADASHLG